MKLSKNFSASEFACKDGSETPCEVLVNLKELAMNLQVLRDHFGKVITVNSGYRSPSHNKAVGGAKSSQHLLGNAADINVVGESPEVVHAAIEELIRKGKMKNGGLGLYKNFVHYDIRNYAARWNG